MSEKLKARVKSDEELRRLAAQYLQCEYPLDWLVDHGLVEEGPKGFRLTEDGDIVAVMVLKAEGQIKLH